MKKRTVKDRLMLGERTEQLETVSIVCDTFSPQGSVTLRFYSPSSPVGGIEREQAEDLYGVRNESVHTQ